MKEPNYGQLLFNADMLYLDDEIDNVNSSVWCANHTWVSFGIGFYATQRASAYAKAKKIDLAQAYQEMSEYSEWWFYQNEAKEAAL